MLIYIHYILAVCDAVNDRVICSKLEFMGAYPKVVVWKTFHLASRSLRGKPEMSLSDETLPLVSLQSSFIGLLCSW